MERIVDIATDKQHLSAFRGFMRVERDGQEVGRIALDDIAAVVVHAHGTTYSNSLLVALAERNALLVACGTNHSPVAWMLPLSGHHVQGARMRAQWQAGKPLGKRLWQDLVRAKVTNQAAILDAFESRSGALLTLAGQVKSGDPDNVEAQAARRYWQLLMGKDFRRDRNLPGSNAMLNYGYTVLRACTGRAIISSGLHPTIGLAHANRSNDFALADDLMEPFRPYVDALVKILIETGQDTVTSSVKAYLAQLMSFDLETKWGISPIFNCVQRLANSLAQSFEKNEADLDIPSPPSKENIAALRRATLGDL